MHLDPGSDNYAVSAQMVKETIRVFILHTMLKSVNNKEPFVLDNGKPVLLNIKTDLLETLGEKPY